LVVKALLDRGLKIVAFKEMKVPRDLAEMHYAVHKEKPFFPWLVDFITSAPVLTMIFESENAIQDIRDSLGATFVQKASPDSLRGKYGIWAGINIAHASDGPDTARDEIALWTTESPLERSPNAMSDVLDYIEDYASGDADYTMDIRGVVKGSIENKDASGAVLESLIGLLKKDSKGIPDADISALASAIFDFIKEEVEKA
jgi:nucleoside-diphosphate kinase